MSSNSVIPRHRIPKAMKKVGVFVEVLKKLPVNQWEHWFLVVTEIIWDSCQNHHVARLVVYKVPLRKVLWTFRIISEPQPSCFLTRFSPAIAGSEHTKDVACWQSCPVHWLTRTLIVYGGKTCLVYKLHGHFSLSEGMNWTLQSPVALTQALAERNQGWDPEVPLRWFWKLWLWGRR